MPLDNVANWAEFTVASPGYNAAATSIALTTDPGSAAPAAPANGWWWNATDYDRPLDDPNREMVRMTARTGANLTISRGQEGTSASTKNTSGKTYKLALGPTADMFNNQIPAAIAAVSILPTVGIPSAGVGVAYQQAWDTAAQAMYLKDPTNGWTLLLQL